MTTGSDRARALERYRAAFSAACARERIRGEIAGDPARFVFAGQEGASAELILEHFLIELGKQGVPAEAILAPSSATGAAEVEARALGLEGALARVRTLLVEYNSYLSGGLPFVFRTSSDVLRGRGLAVYRYPAQAAVEVRVAQERVWIAFEPGALGDVTSSGFYVPTRLAGDFEVRVAYELGRWSPGPDSACLALFAQDEASTVRSYAQVSSWGSPPAFAAQASFTGDVRPPVAIDGAPGELRLARSGPRIRAWHRARGRDWTPLGEHGHDPGADAVIGCKIWSKEACGGLVAELSGLAIEGRPAAEQGPPPAVRPDPRAGKGSASRR